LFYDCDDEEIPAMGDGSGLAEAMLGLDGVRVIMTASAVASSGRLGDDVA
jgi:hypothetical protein